MRKMGRNRCFLPIVFIFLCFSIIQSVPSPAMNITCEYEAMTRFLQEVADNYRQIAQLVTIGITDEGREIWTMIVSDSPHQRPLLRPQVKFVGNVNGVSGSACYVLLRLIKHLVEQYRSEASMERKLLESVEIHIIPNLNPDGYARAVPGSCYAKEGRFNSNGVNLNTNFPDIFSPHLAEQVPFQKETKAMMSWMDRNKFIISVSLISGAKVVEYPFATVIEDMENFHELGEQHLTPDDDIFKHLALTYARKTGTPDMGWYCPSLNRQFPLGIINGAEWQAQQGTMMDFNYIHGTFEITAAISCCRNEDNVTVLEEMWWENREGLLHVIHEVGSGIRGQVLDSETYDAISDANLSKREHDYMEGEDSIYSMPFFSTNQGEFWRPWRPGVYKLRVEAVGYKTKIVDVEVHRHQPTFIRVELEKNTTIHHKRFTTTTTTFTTPSSYSGGEGLQNESIKKMTGPHQSDDFSSDKENSAGINDYDISTTTRSSKTTTRIMETTADENVQQEAPVMSVVQNTNATKRYSSLQLVDHSFINLLKGLGNNSSNSIKGSSSCKIITACLLVCFLLCRSQLSGRKIILCITQ